MLTIEDIIKIRNCDEYGNLINRYNELIKKINDIDVYINDKSKILNKRIISYHIYNKEVNSEYGGYLLCNDKTQEIIHTNIFDEMVTFLELKHDDLVEWYNHINVLYNESEEIMDMLRKKNINHDIYFPKYRALFCLYWTIEKSIRN